MAQSVTPVTEGCATLSDAFDAAGQGVVIMAAADLTALDRGALLASAGRRERARVLLLADGSQCDTISELVVRGAVTGLTGFRNTLGFEELKSTIVKLQRADLFGLEPYFSRGLAVTTRQVTHSDQRAEMLVASRRVAEAAGAHPRYASLYTTVTEEFLTNALYDAPTGVDGKPRYAHLSRGMPVGLAEGEGVVVSVCSEGLRLGISVVDHFGSISPHLLLQNLARWFRREVREVRTSSGGAGLGLAFVLDSVSQFVVNIQPGVRTEMIGIVDASIRLKDFALAQNSFNLFVE